MSNPAFINSSVSVQQPASAYAAPHCDSAHLPTQAQPDLEAARTAVPTRAAVSSPQAPGCLSGLSLPSMSRINETHHTHKKVWYTCEAAGGITGIGMLAGGAINHDHGVVIAGAFISVISVLTFIATVSYTTARSGNGPQFEADMRAAAYNNYRYQMNNYNNYNS